MHLTLKERFVSSFPEMLSELKVDHCLVPVVKLFLEQLEKHGFTLAEILVAESFVVGDQGLKEVSELLWQASKSIINTHEN